MTLQTLNETIAHLWSVSRLPETPMFIGLPTQRFIKDPVAIDPNRCSRRHRYASRFNRCVLDRGHKGQCMCIRMSPLVLEPAAYKIHKGHR